MRTRDECPQSTVDSGGGAGSLTVFMYFSEEGGGDHKEGRTGPYDNNGGVAFTCTTAPVN